MPNDFSNSSDWEPVGEPMPEGTPSEAEKFGTSSDWEPIGGPGAEAAGATLGAPAGMVEEGNLDLGQRPWVKGPDGKMSTERSISITTDKGETLIPTVVGGKLVSNAEAIDHYRKTGENLGTFKDIPSANSYANMLHEFRASQIAPPPKPSMGAGGSFADTRPAVPTLSQGKAPDLNLMEKGLNALNHVGKAIGMKQDLFPIAKVKGISPTAKAQAVIRQSAKEEGVPLSQFRESPGMIEQGAQGFTSGFTGGLYPAFHEALTGETQWEPTTQGEKIAKELGQFGGMVAGVPKAVGATIGAPVSGALGLEAEATEALVPRVTKTVLSQAINLAPMFGANELGTALKKKTVGEAAQTVLDATRSGAMTGIVFGATGGLFPAEVQQRAARIITGLVALNTQRAIEDPEHRLPFNRPLAEVVKDTVMDVFFLWHGLGERGLKQADDMIESGGGGGIVPPAPEPSPLSETQKGFVRDALQEEIARNPAISQLVFKGGPFGEEPGKAPGTPPAAPPPEVPGERRGTGTERRQNLLERKRVAQMTPEEMKQALLTDTLTGLGNRRAFEEAESSPMVASVDVDSLKWVNDNASHEAGDALLSTVGEAFRQAKEAQPFRAGVKAVDAFHVSGDEFILNGQDEASLKAALDAANAHLAKHPFTIEHPDGTKSEITGAFSYGTGKTLAEAEEALQRNKGERLVQGKRAARGEKPPGVVAIGAEGGKAGPGREGAGGKEVTPADSLTVKMKDGKVYSIPKGKGITHADILDKYNLNADDVTDTGLTEKDGTPVWGGGPKVKGIKKPAEPVKPPAEEASALIAKIKAYEGGEHSPSKVKMFQDLGSSVVPGVRLQDAEETGRRYLAHKEGTLSLKDWHFYVEDLHKSNKVRKPKRPPTGEILSVGDEPEKVNLSNGRWGVKIETSTGDMGNGKTASIKPFWLKVEAQAWIDAQKAKLAKKAEGAKPETEQAPEKAKQPWEMTRREWYDNETGNAWLINTKASREKSLKKHERLVDDALSEGKPVPKNVLAEYPKLAKRSEEGFKKPWEMTDNEFQEGGWTDYPQKALQTILEPSEYKKIAKNEGERARDLVYELNLEGVETLDTHKTPEGIVIHLPPDGAKKAAVKAFIDKYNATVETHKIGDYVNVPEEGAAGEKQAKAQERVAKKRQARKEAATEHTAAAEYVIGKSKIKAPAKKVYYTKEVQVKETGETVKMKKEATKALDEIETDLFYLRALRDCLG